MSHTNVNFRANSATELREAKRRANELAGTTWTFPISEILTDELFQTRTSIPAASEFRRSIDFDIFEVAVDFLPEGYRATLDWTIQRITPFESWTSLVTQAAADWEIAVLKGRPIVDTETAPLSKSLPKSADNEIPLPPSLNNNLRCQ